MQFAGLLIYMRRKAHLSWVLEDTTYKRKPILDTYSFSPKGLIWADYDGGRGKWMH
jgi:hypothetical protein